MAQLLQQTVDGVTTGSIYALVALGFSLIFQTSALLSFAHPQLMMLGGLIGYTFLARLHLPFVVALLAAALFAGLLSAAIDALVLRPMRRRKADDNSLIVVTIGVGIILTSAGMLAWGPYSLPYPQAASPSPLSVAGVSVEEKSVAIWIAALVALGLFQLFLRRARLGLAMRAAAADPMAATLCGVPTRATTTISFGLSGALAGIAGVLIGSLYYASFEMGAAGLKSVCAAVIGGFGSLPGAVLGGLLLGLFESFVTVHVSAQFSDIFIYGLLIVFLLFRPQGLLGTGPRKV